MRRDFFLCPKIVLALCVIITDDRCMNYPLQQIEQLQLALDALHHDREAAGKNKYGVFLHPHNEAHHLISTRMNKLQEEYRNSREGILAEIDRAEKEGPIQYAAVHPVSHSTIGFYKYDPSSPSGRIRFGGVPNTPLSSALIAERKVGMRLSGAITHDYRG